MDVGAPPADAVVGGSHTGRPCSGALLDPPVKNTTGTQMTAWIYGTHSHAHQWLARSPMEYFDPAAWQRNR